MGGLGRRKQKCLNARNTSLSAGKQTNAARSGGTPDGVNNWKQAGKKLWSKYHYLRERVVTGHRGVGGGVG
jgi:hypothetical protein